MTAVGRNQESSDAERGSLRCYLREIASSRSLSAEEEAALARRIRKGDVGARQKLVAANLKFVVRIAREYQNQWVSLEDLIGAGNVGLITAANRFDGARGIKLISYAVWWIRQSIRRYLSEQSRMIRLPANRMALLKRIGRYVENQQQTSVHHPDEEEIAVELGESVAMVKDTLIRYSHGISSLDAACGEEDALCLMEMIPDETGEPPDALLMRNALREHIEAALDGLGEREREVVRLHFGLGGTRGMSLAQIGARYGLSRERVRQIREKALLKLRRCEQTDKLVPYAEET